MLSIGKLGNGAESYYLNTVAKGREEYYTGRGEAPGVWLGKGSMVLGLKGSVAPPDLRMVLAGYSPGDAQRLNAGRVDPKRRVPGFDLTFSAPKSVSLLYGLGSPEVAQKVREAHEEAVSAGVDYLERHATKARRGPGGERRIAADGMVAAAFGHRTSRNGDPQLHTHVLVANVVRGADGVWSAPDARLLYHHAHTAGYLYQAVLRHELTRSLGVEFEAVRKGSAEIKGIDPVLRRAFSSRRAEIEEHLAVRGDSSAKAAEVAALATRAPKDPALVGDELGLRERWSKEAIGHGFDPERLHELVAGPSTPGLTETERRHLLATLASPEGLTAHDSTFTRRQTLRAIAERLPKGAELAEIETLADRLLKDPDVVAFPAVDQVGELRYSTSELLELEGSMLEGAQGRLDKGVSVVRPERVERALDAHGHLSEEQEAMVRRLATSGHGVQVVVGRAGAGKTTALAAVRQAYEEEGYDVTGLALSARAAQGLAEGAGIPAHTLARFRYDLDNGHRRIRSDDVLVVDEAGMVGTRELARLLADAERADAKVILVGDPRQLPEIDAGGAFAGLADRLGYVELTENRRQRERWERQALDELRSGDVEVALEAYLTHGRIQTSDTLAEAHQQLVDSWWAARTDSDEVLMLAVTRRDVDALNTLARQRLRGEGVLGADLDLPGPKPFAVGDQVVALRNDRRLDVVNGTRGTVTELREEGLVVATDSGERILSLDYLAEGHLTHGYATTVHKAQGATYDRAFVLSTEALTREAGYVAMSRARGGTELFVVTGAFEDGRHRQGPGDELGQLATRLARSRAKELASSHAEHGSPSRPDRARRMPTQHVGPPQAPVRRRGGGEGSANWPP